MIDTVHRISSNFKIKGHRSHPLYRQYTRNLLLFPAHASQLGTLPPSSPYRPCSRLLLLLHCCRCRNPLLSLLTRATSFTSRTYVLYINSWIAYCILRSIKVIIGYGVKTEIISDTFLYTIIYSSILLPVCTIHTPGCLIQPSSPVADSVLARHDVANEPVTLEACAPFSL